MHPTPPSSLTLHTLRQLYLKHARIYYRRADGDPTREHVNISAALDRFIAHAGEQLPAARVNRFIVSAWIDQLAAERLTRVYINQCLSKVRRWIRWACDLDYVPFSVTEDLRRVHPLKRNRSEAAESPVIVPPSLDQIKRVLPFLSGVPRDVLQLSRLTAARPGEILGLRNGDIDVDQAVAIPQQHKTAHHGKVRVIPLRPEALAIICARWTPMLPDDFLFPSKSGMRHYYLSAYQKALRTACNRARVRVFCPREVRRATARKVRRERGLDATQALLGHANARTTEIYAPLVPGDPMTLEQARRAVEVL